MIEEDIKLILARLLTIETKLEILMKHIIPKVELNDSQKESDESFDIKMPGDEPRRFKNCRKCKAKLKGVIAKNVGLCSDCFKSDIPKKGVVGKNG